jgi:ubiquinone/menaquinone biosynthesis C-methylase UbiE
VTDYLERPRGSSDLPDAALFDELSLWSSRFGALLLEQLELRAGVRALDVGCGTGFPLYELACAHGASSRFVGIDTWREALERAAAKRVYCRAPGVSLLRADAGCMPFRDGSFDLIVSNLGINNFERLATVFAECARVAAPGARVAMTTNPKGHMREFYEVFRGLLEERNRPEELRRLAANEDHRLGREAIAESLGRAGFTVENVVERAFWLRYVDGSALLRHPLTRFGFLDGWRAAVEPADERTVFAALESRLNGLATRGGGLRMTVPMLYIEGRRR